MHLRFGGESLPALVVAGAMLTTVAWGGPEGTGLPLGTDLDDFFLRGTQPDPTGLEVEPVQSSLNCVLCHGDFDQAEPPLPVDAEPYRTWAGSMMGQAGRDPIFWAANTVANQDALMGGDLCLRCHSPAGWLAGRSVPTDGLGLVPGTADFEGVVCHLCHRVVDPVYEDGVSPAEDEAILDDLALDDLVPGAPGSGQYVVDPMDRRRGPFDLGDSFFFHGWLQSPYHRDSAMCGTCHDVSNPLFTRQPDGTYVLNPEGTPHPTGDKLDMFPVERTYSEWAGSAFAAGGVQMDGRFGGNHPTGVMETCQDCHMPDQVAPGCRVPGFEDRPDMPAHFLNGANTWVLRAVDTLYTDGDPPNDPPATYNDPVFTDQTTGLTPEIIQESIDRAVQMLRDASDLELSQNGNRLNVRIINMSGHKLPTGYHEGRRIWINVKFLDGAQQIVAEHGAYDFATGELTASTTKIYEAVHGIDDAMAMETGLPVGPTQHFLLNNVILIDNRIPPTGFTNAGFEAVQSEPVGASYADGQHWDDTAFVIPAGAAEALVTVYHQTTSKEYIEFLRDVNVTDSRGQIAYDQWVLHGRSTPVDMDMATLPLQPLVPGDLDNDGVVDTVDFLLLLAAWGPCDAPCPPYCLGDLNNDCTVDTQDFLDLLANWTLP